MPEAYPANAEPPPAPAATAPAPPAVREGACPLFQALPVAGVAADTGGVPDPDEDEVEDEVEAELLEAPVAEPPGLTPAQRFCVAADRVAARLAEQLDELDASYAQLRAGGVALADFMARHDAGARRILDLDRRLPVPPTECLGEEAALLCALQAAANAALQIAPEDGAGRPASLHHPSFQRSLQKARQHLAEYRAYRARPAHA